MAAQKANDKPVIGASIAAMLTLYAILAQRRRRRFERAQAAGDHRRGREAAEPYEIGAAAWWDILKRVFADIDRDNISLMAAGLAFYALLALTPAFTALIALYGLVFDPAQVQAQLAGIEGVMPEEARKLIADQLTTIVQAGSSRLGFGLLVSLAIALWSANAGTSALMSALNVAYGESEKRSLLRYYGTSLVLTAALILFGIVSLALIAIVPVLLALLPLGASSEGLVYWIRWPLLVLLSSLALATIYRYAPSRNEPRWSWVSAGALAATALWVMGSALFSLYVRKVASYNATYGSLGAIVVLLLWFWVSAFAVLLGAELNAEMEHQTTRDTTDRPEKPMGERGAHVADTLPPPE